MDAISHAIESYVSRRSSPISSIFSLEAFKRLSGSFVKVLKDPSNLAFRSEMLLGAHFAGTAIENSMLGAAHAAANPLTAEYNIEHGTAVSMMLHEVNSRPKM